MMNTMKLLLVIPNNNYSTFPNQKFSLNQKLQYKNNISNKIQKYINKNANINDPLISRQEMHMDDNSFINIKSKGEENQLSLDFEDIFDDNNEEIQKKYGENIINEKLENNDLKIENIKETFKYELDDFQLASITELMSGKSVVVCAPTGAGKTAIADAAAIYTLSKGKKVIYTTPLKALSNQKLYEFRERFGYLRVGLSTGDTSLRLTAPIIIMTTEILRNQIYSVSTNLQRNEEKRNVLNDIGLIVLDEVHYLSDPDRGSVWEEIIVRCPENVQMLCMSATVANPTDLGDWIAQIHGPCTTIKTNKRPVPLTWYFGFSGYGGRVKIEPLFLSKKLNPVCIYKKTGFENPKNEDDVILSNPENRVPKLEYLIYELKKKGFLPAIYFVFSRAACDNYAVFLEEQGIMLTKENERDTISQYIESLQKEQPEAIREECIAALLNGIATHHAGCLPAWKSMIETLFQKGLLKLVFATGTLAAGINMPARTTIVEKISVRRREKYVSLKHNELLQMAGRAGRRGYDTNGNCIILQSLFEGAEDAVNIIKNGPDPLKSQFTTGYSLVLNLLSIFSLNGAKDLLEKSFQNYLSGNGLKKREEKIKRLKRELKSYIKEFREESNNLGLDLTDLRENEEELRVLREDLNEKIMMAKKERAERAIELLLSQNLPHPVLVDVTRNATGYNSFPALLLARKNNHVYCIGSDNFQYKTSIENIVGIGDTMFSKVIGTDKVKAILLRTRKWIIDNVMRVKGNIDSAKVAFMIPSIGNYTQIKWSDEIDLEIKDLKLKTDKLKKELSEYKRLKITLEDYSHKKSNSIEKKVILTQKSLNESLKLKKFLESQMSKSWLGFKATMETLIKTGALDDQTLAIKPFGEVVREINGDNELWLAMIFTHPSVQMLSPPLLSALVSCVIAPTIYNRPNLQAILPIPLEIIQIFEELEEKRESLFKIEVMNRENPNISTGLEIDFRMSGLVEAWTMGCTWLQVMESTSLDDGDIARLLSRTQDMLRQISVSKHLLDPLKKSARQAWNAMDRAPIKDMIQ